jgi:hypothetical protein
MRTSQNGWPALAVPPAGALDWVTGRVTPGPVHTVFAYLCAQFHARVEPITRALSWGWAYRTITGTPTLSNHASGTAIDLNAPAHPFGRAGTFTPTQVTAIEAILGELSAVVRWGGHYPGRKDEMHFEIHATPSAVATVATRVKLTPPRPAPGKTVAAMAAEVIAGHHGNGHEARRVSLGIDPDTYAHVRAEVNRLMTGK